MQSFKKSLDFDVNGSKKVVRIAIICRDAKGGVRTFADGLLFALNTLIPSENIEVTLIHDREKYLNHPALSHFQQLCIPKKGKLIWDYFSSLRALRKHRFDTILYLKNFIPLSHMLLRAKKLVVVHDLCALQKEFREFGWKDTAYTRYMSAPSYRMADKIIAVSESTKDDIVKYFGESAEKIVVIPEAADNCFVRTEPDKTFFEKYKIQKPYLFYCGALSPRKNILRLLQAFESIKGKIEHNIYIAGLLSYRDAAVKEYIEKHLSDRVFLTGKVPLNDLISFYSAADLYLYPSLYEGFGLPILEAQQCGCPVLTSQTTSCPEVAGEGAKVIDPYSIKNIADGILKVVTNNGYRTELIRKGHKNHRQYSWDRAAAAFLQLIQQS